MITVTDARNQIIQLAMPARRIVSLVPSTTESILDFGCQQHLLGITRYCPRDLCPQATLVGGTKDLEMDRLVALQPDLILGNIEENTPQLFAQLEAAGFPLYAAFPHHVDEAIHELLQLGRLVGKQQKAQEWQQKINRLRPQHSQPSFNFIYVIWRNPWMAVNGNTFISNLLEEAGGINHFASQQPRYFEFQWDDVKDLQNTYVLLSSEPSPFRQKHRLEWHEQTSTNMDNIRLIDGAMCSWHGTRIAQALDYLRFFFAPSRSS